jgi:hypothetical protein
LLITAQSGHEHFVEIAQNPDATKAQTFDETVTNKEGSYE